MSECTVSECIMSECTVSECTVSECTRVSECTVNELVHSEGNGRGRISAAVTAAAAAVSTKRLFLQLAEFTEAAAAAESTDQ